MRIASRRQVLIELDTFHPFTLDRLIVFSKYLLFKSFFILISAASTPSNTRTAPMYPLVVRISPMKIKAKNAANTGSNEKIRPVRVGVVYFWATAWPINPTALHRILKPKIAIHESVVLGSCGFSKINEKRSPHAPANPSCMILMEMASACFVTFPVTMM